MKWVTAILAIIVLGLVGLGIAVQASISNVQGVSLNGNPTHFLVQQILYFGLALIGCVFITAIKPEIWARKDVAVLLCLFVILALLSVHIPGIGKTTKGSTRWIVFFGFTLQPSEFVKIVTVVLMAWWQGRPECVNSDFKQGVLIPILCLGIISVGFLSQPDFGSAIMLCAVNGPLMLVAGARFKHLLPFALLGIIIIAVLVSQDPERMSRFTSVKNVSTQAQTPIDDADSYQLRQSILSLESGGLKGIGFGNSVFKRDYLPENHTDFVFAMIGEELGFIVGLTCLVLFWLLMLCGVWISLRAPTLFTRLLSLGMTLHIGLSAGVNLGVVTGLLPTKGLALPFLSYGGSNLVSSLAAIGFILAVGWRCPPTPAKPRSYYDPDRKVWIS